jgi:hypothetical protein
VPASAVHAGDERLFVLIALKRRKRSEPIQGKSPQRRTSEKDSKAENKRQ